MTENCQHVRANADRIPTDIRDKVLTAIEHAEETEKWNRVLVDGWAKESEKHIAEIAFLKAEIKRLVDAIRAATSKKPPCEAADACMERVRDRAQAEEQKRLAAELAARNQSRRISRRVSKNPTKEPGIPKLRIISSESTQSDSPSSS